MHGNEENLPAMPENEVQLEAQKDLHSYQYAMKNVELMAQDNREVREHMAGNRVAGTIVVLVTILAVFIFFMYALHLGKETFLSDMIKVTLGAFGGGGIGYVIGSKRNKK